MAQPVMQPIAEELQGVALGESGIARAVAVAEPTNHKVRECADARLRFEDEPAHFISFLRDAAGDS